MAAFDYGNPDPQTNTVNSISPPGSQSSFDSTGMNYDSGMSAPKFDTGQANLPKSGDTSQPSSIPVQTNGTLLGTSVAPQMSMPAGIDPRLASLYQKSGLNPGDRGSGFADWQYWQNDAVRNANGDWNYVLGRLGNNLAGTGTDQPTGTPGQGIWNNSGRNQQGGNDNNQFLSMLMQMLFGQQNQPIEPVRNYAQPYDRHLNSDQQNNSQGFSQLMQALGLGGSSQAGRTVPTVNSPYENQDQYQRMI